jgi:hypothetical protein
MSAVGDIFLDDGLAAWLVQMMSMPRIAYHDDADGVMHPM